MIDLYRLKQQAVQLAIVLGLAIVVGASFPRHTNLRQAWGFPFEYRFQYRLESSYPGVIEVGATSGFNFFLLFLNIWLLFFTFIIALYFLIPVIREIKQRLFG